MACMHICHACIQASSNLPLLADENGIEHRVGEHRALVQGWLKRRPQVVSILEAHYIDDSCALGRVCFKVLGFLTFFMHA